MSVDRDELKRAAAMRAIEEVGDGMVLGLGTGSTAAFVVEGLARRVAGGLRVVGIPTSERTASQARRLGIPIATFAEYQTLDLTIDGADEVQLGTLDLIKGLGGALPAVSGSWESRHQSAQPRKPVSLASRSPPLPSIKLSI